jgi:hypothetical protein
MLWPQILALSFAVVLIILTGSVLVAYFRGGKAADQADDVRSKFVTYFPEVLDKLHTIFPMSVTISMFATSSNTNALQFQSCSNSPPPFPNINFSGICQMQACPLEVVCAEYRHSFNTCRLLTLYSDMWLP